MLCLDSNAEYVKVDSDSEINWDEDEDLGDAEIPGLISIFSQNLFINFFTKNTSLITVFLLLIVLLNKDDESESLNCPQIKLAL